MLIFESQREARGRTVRLLLAFALTVLLLVVAGEGVTGILQRSPRDGVGAFGERG